MSTKSELDSMAAGVRTRPAEPMTFADAIRLGASFTEQASGSYTDLSGTACALTGAYLAVTAPQVPAR